MTPSLSIGSHSIVTCECEFKTSPKCRGHRTGEFRDFQAIRSRNAGRYICVACSRHLKSSGRNNPNARYNVDDRMFKVIDTEAKAYLLGFIASDGSLGKGGQLAISIHKRDIDVLFTLKRVLNLNVPILPRRGIKAHMVTLCLNSTELMRDAAALLGVPLGGSMKKDRLVQMPTLKSETLQWAFIRGYFDGDGSVNEPTRTHRSPQVSIASQSMALKEAIRDFCKMPCTINDNCMWWYGNTAVDFLERLYGGRPEVYLNRKADLYAQWATWVPALLKGPDIRGLSGGIQWVKTRTDAVPPSKARASDSGYDLTAIDVLKSEGGVTFYRTGVKITPPFGYYCDLVSRSSVTKTGYMMAHGIGVIDRTYVGEVIIPMRKVDMNAPDLVLPCRIAQLIPRQIVHFDLIEVDDLEQSSRAAGGFGSTGEN